MVSPGHLFVISAPSGAGKTSLVKALLASTPNLVVSVSHTTRKQRPGEINGVDYHFVTPAEFMDLIQADAFLEHAQVYDNWYGTSQQAVEANLAAGKDVLLEIDWQGARQIQHKVPDSSAIFILPPSRTSLEQRLQQRGQDSADIIARRMAAAIDEMSHYADADYLVINDVFAEAQHELQTIILAARLDSRRQSQKHQQLIRELLAKDAGMQ